MANSPIPSFWEGCGQCFLLGTELGTEDMWKVVDDRADWSFASYPVNPGSTLINMLLVMLVTMGARENMSNCWANGPSPPLCSRCLMAGIVVAETVRRSILPVDFCTFPLCFLPATDATRVPLQQTVLFHMYMYRMIDLNSSLVMRLGAGVWRVSGWRDATSREEVSMVTLEAGTTNRHHHTEKIQWRYVPVRIPTWKLLLKPSVTRQGGRRGSENPQRFRKRNSWSAMISKQSNNAVQH